MKKSATRVPLLIFPLERVKPLTHRMVGLFKKLVGLYPGLQFDLESARMKISAADYLAACFPSALFWGLFPFALTTGLLTLKGEALEAVLPKTAPTLLIGALIYGYYVFFPRIQAGKISEQVDRELVFVLKDMLVQISSGVPLFESMQIVAKSSYGIVSEEFADVVRQVKVGIPIEDALQNLAVRTNSEYMRKVVWQVVNGFKAGASLKGILQTLVENMSANQTNQIRSYAQELNMWILVYMMFAVAAPTIGATLMVVLSAVAGVGITPGLFITMIVGVLFMQIVLIGFVKSRRPVVNV